MVTRSTSFGPTAATADTKTTIGSAYAFPGSGNIKTIRVAGYNGVTDKATSSILTLDFKGLAGPFEFACYGAGEEITVGGKRATEEIDVDIPYNVGMNVTVSLTASEALEDCIVSLLMVEA